MSLRKTLLLAILLFGLLYYIFSSEIDRQAAVPDAVLLFPKLAFEEVQRVKIVNSYGTLVFQQAGTKQKPEASVWKLADIPQAIPDQQAINQLLTALLEAKVLSPFIPDQPLSGYGLDPAKVEVVVSTAGRKRVFRIGGKSSYLQMNYLQLARRRELFLVDQSLLEELDKRQIAFRVKKPLIFEAKSVNRIILRRGPSEVVLQKQAEKNWLMFKPARHQARLSAIESLLNSLQEISVVEFKSVAEFNKQGTAQAAGVALPDSRIEVVLGFDQNTEQVEMALWGLESESAADDGQAFLWIKGRSWLYRISAASVPRLSLTPDYLRENRFFGFKIEEVQKLSLDYRDRSSIKIEKKAELWFVNHKQADQIFVRQLLKNLSELKAEAFPDYKPQNSINNPSLRVTVELSAKSGESRELVLKVGDKLQSGDGAAPSYLAQSSGEFFVIGAAAFRRISPREEALLEAAVLPADHGPQNQ